MRRVAELGGDAGIELFGEHALERVGLAVDAIPGHGVTLTPVTR